jgi:1-acyl-sn-glycerol-3-phosphate acyltransferase
LRVTVLGLVVYGGLLLLLLIRLAERPLLGAHRPVSPRITQGVCRLAFPILGIRWHVRGRPIAGQGAFVANHVSWLDIFALNAAAPLYFVSKAEVAGWPGIGWLARATGTEFIARDRREAGRQRAALSARVAAGHRLLFFPEGTSTDGLQVLPFKPTLFEAFLNGDAEGVVQPVSVIWHAPEGADPRIYGWWGEMEFGPHFRAVLSARRQGRVELCFHAAIRVADHATRKELARACEEAVRKGHAEALGRAGGAEFPPQSARILPQPGVEAAGAADVDGS